VKSPRGHTPGRGTETNGQSPSKSNQRPRGHTPGRGWLGS
jgi:hypothetical protein